MQNSLFWSSKQAVSKKIAVSLKNTLWYEQRTVAVAQETEVVLESVIVDFVPIAMEEGTHKKEQRGLWLVEIGYQHLHYLVLKAWGYDNLRTRMECL